MLVRGFPKRILYRVLPTLASVLLLAGIGYTVISRFHDASTPIPSNNEVGEMAKARERTSSPSAIETTPLTGNIEKLHLFGEAPQKAPAQPPPPSITVAEETTLDLVLHGIISASGEGESLAIIADAQGKQDAYPVGAELSRGVTLMEVNSDYVVLFNNNQMETLCMWEVPQDGSGQSQAERFLPTATHSGMDRRRSGRERRYRRRPPRSKRPPPGAPPRGIRGDDR
uniref:Type IV pilus biogenesis n=1 Tax=Candidatus Kentrum sp. FW TaxID=2126338 RepID=A0A450RVM3_9GAMM|nr:MAG: Type IV pilus biogenesis [Candidatus Kentron sp. FW]VFJ70612.1 MAG: Type IV pilus biogenesis [Candidatus Kentron sp. FW]